MNLQQLRRAIIAMRVIARADTPEGHRWSTIEQQIKNLPTAIGIQRDRLLKSMHEQMRQVKQLAARRGSEATCK